MAIIVQLLDKNNAIIQTHKLQQDRFTIGRDYHCDVVLNDPYVNEVHCQVSVDEQQGAQLKDMASMNGTKVNKQKVEHGRVDYKDTITIGRTRLRIFDSEYSLPETQKLGRIEEQLEWLNSKITLLFLLFGVIAVEALKVMFFTTDEIKINDAATDILSLLLVLSLFPIFFSVMCLLNRKDTRFFNIASLTLLSYLLLELMSRTETLIVFNTDSSALIGIITKILSWSMATLALWLAFYLCFHQRPLKRNLIVGSLISIVLTINYLPSSFDDEFVMMNTRIKGEVMVPAFFVASKSSADDFISELDKQFKKLEKEKADK